MEELKELEKEIGELESLIYKEKTVRKTTDTKALDICISFHRNKMRKLLTYYDCVERIKKAIKPKECFKYDDGKTGEKWLRVVCPKCGNEHNTYVGTTDYHCGECGQLLDMSDWRKHEEK